MKLEVKFSNLSAGKPIAIINKKLSEKSGIHIGDRVYLEKGKKDIICIVDIAKRFINQHQVGVSSEVKKRLALKQGDEVNLRVALKPESTYFISQKFKGKRLSKEHLEKIMSDIVKNALSEAEIAYFVSSIYHTGMNEKETKDLIKALVSSGKKLNLDGNVMCDKHSIGGVPGRTTPIIVSICAAAGLKLAKTSSRAITSPSGTADSMEVLSKVDFNLEEIKKIIKKTGACIVWGGSLNLAPADDKLIRVEGLIDIDPQPQLLASIIAKKISVGARYILIDIPYGKDTKVNKKEAKELARKFRKIGKSFGLEIGCFLKKTREPLGNGIGPALEIQDALKVLRREDSCHLLEKRSLQISGKLLELSGKAKKGRGYKLAKEILNSGKAFNKFVEIIKAQKGKLKSIGMAKYSRNIKSKKSGKIRQIKINKINSLARIAGCPLDKFSGLYLYKHINEKVNKGETILTIYAETKEELKGAVELYKKTKPIVIN